MKLLAIRLSWQKTPAKSLVMWPNIFSRMNTLLEELTPFARAIRGEASLPDNLAVCPRYSVSSAIDIYRNNYRGNLHDALASIFPVMVQIVGSDFFRHLAYQFIEQHPSRSGNLHDYGAELPNFLATFSATQHLPYLPDVATLEWACHRAYYAPDAPAFDVTRLQQISAAQYAELVWLCHPACWHGYSAYPVVNIWHAHQADASPDFHIDLDRGGGSVLV
ncbi:MAG: DNA-binding domain-containing protein, partial [Gallionellaceae bacterium]|nr:DNA-binding domain-containing protein [Gallionellaceae bacterium]